jgi:hypothetical protein
LASPNKTANTAAKPPVCTNPKTDIETVTAHIEAAAVDIAPDYVDWRDLGFALADALGERAHLLQSFKSFLFQLRRE